MLSISDFTFDSLSLLTELFESFLFSTETLGFLWISYLPLTYGFGIGNYLAWNKYEE